MTPTEPPDEPNALAAHIVGGSVPKSPARKHSDRTPERTLSPDDQPHEDKSKGAGKPSPVADPLVE